MTTKQLRAIILASAIRVRGELRTAKVTMKEAAQ